MSAYVQKEDEGVQEIGERNGDGGARSADLMVDHKDVVERDLCSDGGDGGADERLVERLRAKEATERSQEGGSDEVGDEEEKVALGGLGGLGGAVGEEVSAQERLGLGPEASDGERSEKKEGNPSAECEVQMAAVDGSAAVDPSENGFQPSRQAEQDGPAADVGHGESQHGAMDAIPTGSNGSAGSTTAAGQKRGGDDEPCKPYDVGECDGRAQLKALPAHLAPMRGGGLGGLA